MEEKELVLSLVPWSLCEWERVCFAKNMHPINVFGIMSQGWWNGTCLLKGNRHAPNPTTPSLPLFAIPCFAFFLPQSPNMSGDSEMAISEVSTVESVFRGAAEAPKRAGGRAAGEDHGAARAALHEQLARLQAATGPDAQEEAMARAMRKAQLWATRKVQLAGNPALAQAVEELEHLNMVSSTFLLFLARS